MNDEIFGKNQSATTTKQFFFIVVTCLKYLCNEEEFNTVKMWYPPRTVNEQLEFKKAVHTVFGKLQAKGKIPKNFLLTNKKRHCFTEQLLNKANRIELINLKVPINELFDRII